MNLSEPQAYSSCNSETPRSPDELIKSWVTYSFEEPWITSDTQEWSKNRDFMNYHNPASDDRLSINPIVSETYDILKSWVANIHNNSELLTGLLSWKKDLLKYVFRWWDFCFSTEQQTEMKELVHNGNFEAKAWARFLDDEGQIRGRVPGDGNVLEHELAQSRIIADYWKFDLLNKLPQEQWGEVETGFLYIQSYIFLQLLWLNHDDGEIGEWDVIYDLKQKPISRDTEYQSGIALINSLDISDELKAKVLGIYNIDFDTEHEHKPLFSLYEKMSYMNGAIQTFNTIWTSTEIIYPYSLIHNVLKNQICPMVHVATGDNTNTPLRSMQCYLSDNKNTISKMFKLLVDEDFKVPNENDNWNFKLANKTWLAYLTQWEKG